MKTNIFLAFLAIILVYYMYLMTIYKNSDAEFEEDLIENVISSKVDSINYNENTLYQYEIYTNKYLIKVSTVEFEKYNNPSDTTVIVIDSIGTPYRVNYFERDHRIELSYKINNWIRDHIYKFKNNKALSIVRRLKEQEYKLYNLILSTAISK